jgi:hypothetical protein
MDAEKLIAALATLWARHSPTLVVHAVVIALLGGWALSGNQGVALEAFWPSIRQALDDAIKEVGLPVERGYVLAALGYVYLEALQWLAVGVTRLPGLRVTGSVNRWRMRSFDIAYAARFFPGLTDPYWVASRVNELVYEAARLRVDRTQRPAEARESLWARYFGLGVLVAAGLLAWRLSGAAGARSFARVDELLLLACACSGFARYRYADAYERRLRTDRMDAAQAYGREHPAAGLDEPSESLRIRLLDQNAKHRDALARSAAAVLDGLLRPWPSWMVARVLGRVNQPPAWRHADAALLASALSRMDDEKTVPAAGLRVGPFKRQFEDLLRCRGAGLCRLVLTEDGLETVIGFQDSQYAFDRRAHGFTTFGVRYERSIGAGHGRRLTFAGQVEESWAVFADAGAVPLALLATGMPPSGAPPSFPWELLSSTLDTSQWTRNGLANGEVGVPGLVLASSVEVMPGHSYALRARTAAGSEVTMALQCFAVEGEPGLLLAWRLLKVDDSKVQPPVVAPWWRVSSWRGVLREPKPRPAD